MDKTILIIATLDTKEREAMYLKEKIEGLGCSALLMDAGILAEPAAAVDVTRNDVARAANETIDALVKSKNKGRCIHAMIEGVAALSKKLFEEGRFSGVIGIGGAQGTDIGTAGMRVLPFGVPKFMVSTVASGLATFGPYVGTKDIIMMHSVADLQGLNTVTKTVLDNAAAAVCGMVTKRKDPAGRTAGKRRAVAMSMLGTTTPGALRAKETLEREGFEVVSFHQNGTGGIAMEDMILEGMFDGVLDINLHEIGDRVVRGLHGAIRDYRLESAGKLGVPQVVAPGSIYYTVQGPYDGMSEEYKKRKYIIHNPNLTLVRLSDEELCETAEITASKLNAAKGPVHLFLPLLGMAYPDREGLGHWDPEADGLFMRELKKALDPKVPVDELNAHINDPEFIDPVVERFLSFMRKEV
jgi:uncharacterized protein (UPF0261 family)